MHEKYRFFSLYVVQKCLKFFLYEPKNLCKLQKNTANNIKFLKYTTNPSNREFFSNSQKIEDMWYDVWVFPKV